MAKTGNRSSTEYEKMGRELESLYDAINPDKRRLYRTTFIKGIIGGVGGVIGATVVIALVIWILSWVGHIPLIGHFVDAVKHTLQKPPAK